ncbi:MAG: DUF2723 domain-containing protein [Sphingobacteriales bacterium]|nr:DUF2723 domain-containing protein [Sphingobacteriales bacterium]
MNFRKVNNITGWLIFLIALGTYFLTREARGSLWDCGEFVSSADKMQLPHPPGAPLFVLLGRFFIILFGDNTQTAASAVNFMSAMASAGTILFLFWSITHFARKMFVTVGEELSGQQIFTTMAAGVLGGLAYTFSDSFWFSAVEGEVYALSSFFTALVFWAMLKWEHADEHAGHNPDARLKSDRWIVFLFFMMGLSIGVHLLNLLTIPAIVMIYYYRRYEASTKGAILAFIMGCLITGLVQVAIIQYSMKAAGQFDVFFVNSLGMPFFSGFAIYFVLLAAVILWALSFKEKTVTHTKLIIWFVLFLFLSALPFVIVPGEGLKFLPFILLTGVAVGIGYFIKPSALRVIKLSLWCYTFMMLGYFMYFTAIIRSNANPSIDMNNVDNPINLVYYLSREQYGSAPLVYGPHFAASPQDDLVEGEPFIESEMKYVKGADKYIQIGKTREYNYKSDVKQLFPRVWDPSDDQGHAQAYAEWLGLGQDPQTGKYDAPSYGDNLEWFFSYQMSHMYWRYFMWNFSGKQNDIQGYGNKRDGNWITGVSFVDNKRLGDQSMLPDSIKNNKAHNQLYMLPFILGIIGCVYQFLHNRKDWIVTFLLFFFTGIAVVLYLNQPGNQPRERDYAYVGSFYAFAIWIGLAVVAFVKMAREKAEQLRFQNMLVYGSALSFLVTFMSCFPGSGDGALIASVFATLLYIAVTAGVTYLVRALSSGGTNERMLNISTSLLCIAVPVLMAQQVWDDHDRSNKTTAPAIAKAYLESCAPNAILFTFGDNDTYPLWYAQEVEGIRPDVRVINNSLLGIDWYINQLRYKVNESDSVNIIWNEGQIMGNNRNYVVYEPKPSIPQNVYYNLYSIMKDYVGSDDPGKMDNSRGEPLNTYPVFKVAVPVDRDLVLKNGTALPTDSILPEFRFELPKRALVKNDLIILNIIAANNWKRPIYFTSPMGELGFGPYYRKEGIAYRLVPVMPKFSQMNWMVDQSMRRNGLNGAQIRDVNPDTIYKNLMSKYEFGGANIKGVYFDEENRRHILNLRSIYGEAAGNLADAGKKEEAKQLIDKAEAGIRTDNLPYAMTSRYNGHNQTALIYLEACYKAGKTELAEKIRAEIKKDLEQQARYYNYIRENKPAFWGGFERTEAPINERLLLVLADIEAKYAPKTGNKPATTEGPSVIDNTARPNSNKPKDTN